MGNEPICGGCLGPVSECYCEALCPVCGEFEGDCGHADDQTELACEAEDAYYAQFDGPSAL